jgi:1-acyl-sn-glycerol-3-phosphate acyltransferase
MKRTPLFAAITALRSAVFDVIFFIWGVIASLSSLVLYWITPSRAAIVFIARTWMRGVDLMEPVILGLKYDLRGKENLPAPPYIVAMQHQSAWETFKLLLWFPEPAIVLKEELLDLPIWGDCARRYGAIPVKRSRKADDLTKFLKESRAMAETGRPIVLYPQGTRTGPGKPSIYNRGVAALQEELKIPIVPVTLDSGQYWGKNAFMKYAGTIHVKIHPPIPPGLAREEVMDQIRKLYEGEA